MASLRTVLVLAVVLVLALGATGWLGYDLGMARGDRQTLKMMRAGEAAVAKRDLMIRTTLEKAREDLAAVSARPPKRVYCRSSSSLPKATSGTVGEGAATPDRLAHGTDLRDYDYGSDLRAARDALILCNSLIEITR